MDDISQTSLTGLTPGMSKLQNSNSKQPGHHGDSVSIDLSNQKQGGVSQFDFDNSKINQQLFSKTATGEFLAIGSQGSAGL